MLVKLPQDPSVSIVQYALSYVDLSGANAGITVLARGLHEHGAAVSPDGTRLAAAVPTSDPKGTVEFRAWDLRSGKQVGRLGGVPPQEGFGHLALDGSGSRLFTSWVPLNATPPAGLPADIRGIASPLASVADTLRAAATVHVSVWTVSGDQLAPTVMQFAPSWLLARPLGSGDSTPIALFGKGAIGLVLSSAAGDAQHKLDRPLPSLTSLNPRDAVKHLCHSLTDQTESADLRKRIPKGAYTGAVCP
jgi:hypothetical protein